MRRLVVLLWAAWLPSVVAAQLLQSPAPENPESGGVARVQAWPVGVLSALPGALAVSGDGRIGAHVDGEGRVRVWDAGTAHALDSPALTQASSVALNHDGSLMAVGHLDGRLTLWPRAAAVPLHEFRGHLGRLLTLAFSPDGQHLASGSADGTTQLFDVASGRRLRVFDSLYADSSLGDVAMPIGLAFANDGRWLLVHDWLSGRYENRRAITRWELAQGLEISTTGVAQLGADGFRNGQAVGAGGRLLAYAGIHGLVVQSLASCASPRTASSGAYADTVAADPQGRWVAAAMVEELVFFDTVRLAEVGRAKLPASVLSLVPAADGSTVFAVLAQQPATVVRIALPAALEGMPAWAPEPGSSHCIVDPRVSRPQGFELPAVAATLTVTARLAPSPDVKRDALNPVRELRFNREGLVLALYDGTRDLSGVLGWQPKDRRLVRERWVARPTQVVSWAGSDWVGQEPDGGVTWLSTGRLAIPRGEVDMAAGPHVAADGDSGELYRVGDGAVHAYATDGRQRSSTALKGPMAAIAASAGRLAVLYRDGRVEIFSGTPLRAIGMHRLADLLTDDQSVPELRLTADGDFLYARLFSANSDSSDARVTFRLRDGQEVGSGTWLTAPPARATRAVTQDNRPHRLAVWDHGLGAVIARLPRQRSRDAEGHLAPLQTAISDDGRRVASASPDGLVRVWDIDAHRLLGEVRVGAEVTALAFDAAARRLAVARAGGEVWLLGVP